MAPPYAGVARWKAAVAGAASGEELSRAVGKRLLCVRWVLSALVSPVR